MVMIFFNGNKGISVPFLAVKRDGTTVKDLTGLTLTWTFKDRNGDIPSGSPVSCNVLDAAAGTFDATIPAGLFTEETKYRCQIHFSDGADYEEDSKPFWVEVGDNNS